VSERLPRLLVVNPNTDVRVTGWLLSAARDEAGNKLEIAAVNASSGLMAIETPEHAMLAARAVVTTIAADREAVAAVIAAFGDPGLAEARATCAIPIVGLGEAGLRRAGENGRRFSIVTLGAAMREAIAARAVSMGLGSQLAEIRVVPFSIAEMVDDPDRRRYAVTKAIRLCATETVLLGGAPFAGLGAELGHETGRAVIDGVAAAVAAAHSSMTLRA
jgi:Asp/Glu/hydantoin racemase